MDPIRIENVGLKEFSSYLFSKIHALQESLLRKPGNTSTQGGFLIGSFTENELKGMLRHGKLICAFRGADLLGFLLVTSIDEFLAFNPPLKLDYSNFEYLSQIAVSSDHAKQGLGTRLLRRCVVEAPRGILADVVVKPFDNQVSLQFFKKNGFQTAGTLQLNDYLGFEKLEAEVLTWQR